MEEVVNGDYRDYNCILYEHNSVTDSFRFCGRIKTGNTPVMFKCRTYVKAEFSS